MDFKIRDTVLETERLILDSWKQSDLNDFNEYASVEGVGEAAGWVHHQSLEETQRVLDLFIEGDDCFAIRYKANNKVIGSFGIMNSVVPKGDYEGKLGKEIGYVLSKDYWGQGLMSEAAKCVVSFLFDEWKCDYILCGYFSFNNRSKRVGEKLGFKPYYDKEVVRPSGNYLLKMAILEK